MTNIHGHDVIEKILAAKEGFTRRSLEEAIIGWFGAEARFFTCSAEGMTAAELIVFLEERGKFMPADAGFTVNPEKVCSHGGDHD